MEDAIGIISASEGIGLLSPTLSSRGGEGEAAGGSFESSRAAELAGLLQAEACAPVESEIGASARAGACAPATCAPFGPGVPLDFWASLMERMIWLKRVLTPRWVEMIES